MSCKDAATELQICVTTVLGNNFCVCLGGGVGGSNKGYCGGLLFSSTDAFKVPD